MSHSLQGGYIHSHVRDPPAPVIKLMHLADEAEAQIETKVIQELTDHAWRLCSQQLPRLVFVELPTVTISRAVRSMDNDITNLAASLQLFNSYALACIVPLLPLTITTPITAPAIGSPAHSHQPFCSAPSFNTVKLYPSGSTTTRSLWRRKQVSCAKATLVTPPSFSNMPLKVGPQDVLGQSEAI